MTWWQLAILIWWAFGMVVVNYFYPCWRFLEILLSGPLWPLVAWREIRSLK